MKKEIQKIRDDIISIIQNSKATFFVNKDEPKPDIPSDELLYELRAEICDNCERYFYDLKK